MTLGSGYCLADHQCVRFLLIVVVNLLLLVLPRANVMINLREVALYSNVDSFTLYSNKVVDQM